MQSVVCKWHPLKVSGHYSSNKTTVIWMQPPFFKKSNQYMLNSFPCRLQEKVKMVIHFPDKHIFQNFLLHIIWEKVISTLTGRKLDIEYLLSVYLSIGEMLVAFTSFKNFQFDLLLLIAVVNGVFKISADNGNNLIGILNTTVDFLGLHFLISSPYVLIRKIS